MNNVLMAIGGVLVAIIGVLVSVIKGKSKKIKKLETTVETETKNKEVAKKAVEEVTNIVTKNKEIEKETEKAKDEGVEAYNNYIDDWNNGN